MTLIRSVACAISGGVDSAVSAYLLKLRGFQVKGVFMTNWDNLDENSSCSVDADRADAKQICRVLDIPFYELSFVKEYWIYVFQPLLRCYELGATPNPDIICNRFVKFNFFTRSVLGDPSQVKNSDKQSLSPNIICDAVATGHYCQNSHGNFLEKSSSDEPCLMRSVDNVKDQTFWLSTISHEQLRRFMFPIGSMCKPEVKRLAAGIGLESTAARRESMGMCFIGKRRFSNFIDNYINPKSGLFKEFSTGVVLDEHTGIHHYTLGQRAPIRRATGPFFVARMDTRNQDIYVVRDPHHPALFMRKCWTGPAVWINSNPPELPSDRIEFQWQNKWRPLRCKIQPFDAVEQAASAFWPPARLALEIELPNASDLLNTIDTSCETNRQAGPCLAIELSQPMRCITAGQWAALYRSDRCLGGALICGSVSLWEDGCDLPYRQWDCSNYELTYASDVKSGY